MAFGPGGGLAELIGEATFRLAPLERPGRGGARHIRQGGASRRGFRGEPAADVRSLTDLVLRLGRLADDLPQVAELDLNPVLADSDAASPSTPASGSLAQPMNIGSRAGERDAGLWNTGHVTVSRTDIDPSSLRLGRAPLTSRPTGVISTFATVA